MATYTFTATATCESYASALAVSAAIASSYSFDATATATTDVVVTPVVPPTPPPPVIAPIPCSTAPRAVSYLYSAIKAQIANDANIYLSIGDPGVPDPPDIIEVCSQIVRNWEHFTLVGTGRAGAGYEKYQIIYKISCALHGATEAEIAPVVMARVWTLVCYVEMAVRADPSFGGLLVEGWPGQVSGGEPKWNDSGSAMLCEVTGRVQCEAPL